MCLQAKIGVTLATLTESSHRHQNEWNNSPNDSVNNLNYLALNPYDSSKKNVKS